MTVQNRFQPGWVWLGLLADGRLIITQTNNHDNNQMKMVVDINCIPILCLDLWEHAYWQEHDGEATGSYLDAFWQTVDWDKVSKHYEEFNLNG